MSATKSGENVDTATAAPPPPPTAAGRPPTSQLFSVGVRLAAKEELHSILMLAYSAAIWLAVAMLAIRQRWPGRRQRCVPWATQPAPAARRVSVSINSSWRRSSSRRCPQPTQPSMRPRRSSE